MIDIQKLESTPYADQIFLCTLVVVLLANGWALGKIIRSNGLLNLRFFGFSVALLLASFFYLIHGIEQRAITQDEDQQFFFSTRCDVINKAPGCMLDGAADAQQPPTYYFMQKYSVKLFGVSALSARLPSVIGAVLAVFFAFLLLVLVTQNYAYGIFAALHLGLQPYFYFYAQEGRPHMLALGTAFLALIAIYEYWKNWNSLFTFGLLISSFFLFLFSAGLQPPIFILCAFITIAVVTILASREQLKKIPRLYLACVLSAGIYFPYAIWCFLTAKKFGWTKSLNFLTVAERGQLVDVHEMLLDFLGRPTAHYFLVVTFLAFLLQQIERRKETKVAQEIRFFYFFFLLLIPVYYYGERLIFSAQMDHIFNHRYALCVLAPIVVALTMALFSLAKSALLRPLFKFRFVPIVFLALSLLLANLSSRNAPNVTNVQMFDWRALLSDIRENSHAGDHAIVVPIFIWNAPANRGFFTTTFYYPESNFARSASLRSFWRRSPSTEDQILEAIYSKKTNDLLLAFQRNSAVNQTMGPDPVVSQFGNSETLAGRQVIVKSGHVLVKFTRNEKILSNIIDTFAKLSIELGSRPERKIIDCMIQKLRQGSDTLSAENTHSLSCSEQAMIQGK